MIKEISKQRFDALTFAVLPTAHLVFEEITWFSDENEHFLAAIVFDKIDNDWGFVILARNEKHIFNCIDANHSFEKIADAKDALLKKIAEYIASDEHIHPQDDGIIEKQDIFMRRADDKKLHEHFILLRDSEGHTPAKRIIQEIAQTFVDCDGFFFKRFQTTEFDQRLWELYLYAYLHEERFEIMNEHSSPDYHCKKGIHHICIEATTVNPPNGSADKRAYTDPGFKPNQEYNCIKFSKSLMKKLGMRYWEKPHVKNKPFIIAIQSYEDLVDSQSLITYVYGLNHSWKKDETGNLLITPEKVDYHTHKGKHTQSGFFSVPNSENISAILFSNSGTISKFNRMGKLAGFGSERVILTRIGTCVNRDPSATTPLQFKIEVTPEKYSETWGQGIGMLHNPNALHPVDPALFPNIEHHFLEDGQIICKSTNEFIPFNSITIITINK